MKRSPSRPRTDLTTGECRKLIGALLGALVQMAEPNDVLSAVRWWADDADSWHAIVAIANVVKREQKEERK